MIGPGIVVELLSAAQAPAGRARRRARRSRRGGAGGCRAPAVPPLPSGPLGNPKLTFEQFVIGDCNRLAHAAALTVAEMPAQAYNPLFICGPPGVGKTHLLNSIATLLLSHSPGLAVRCTTGEAFTNEFLGALGAGHTEDFKARFRAIDVLLVDDVQFLEHKTKTEEEFFHTFNALHDAGQQIVLSSDRPPRDLQALEDRLRERFEAGLVADIELPGPRHASGDPAHARAPRPHRAGRRRRAGGHRRARAEQRPRARGRADPRGGLQLSHRPPDHRASSPRRSSTASTRELLPPRPSAARSPTSRPLPATSSASRARSCCPPRAPARIAAARQVAMYLARELSGESLPAIGRGFGGRDHTTVLHAWRRTSARLAEDPASREAVENMCRALRNAIIGRPRAHDRCA